MSIKPQNLFYFWSSDNLKKISREYGNDTPVDTSFAQHHSLLYITDFFNKQFLWTKTFWYEVNSVILSFYIWFDLLTNKSNYCVVLNRIPIMLHVLNFKASVLI